MGWISVDVDLDDVWSGMDRSDKRSMAEWLYDDGSLGSHPNPEIRRLVRGNEESNGEKELRDNLSKLWNGHYQLTNEEENLIKQIANRL
jgi:hypothetical protein